LIIPKSAVNNNNEVYVVRDGCAYVQTVETGMSDDDNIEILSGLNKGDEVVTVGAYLLADGVQVRVVNSDTGSSAQSE
jgi:multidrug efflux pump subunit AcrA (membrane-fusion protein)